MSGRRYQDDQKYLVYVDVLNDLTGEPYNGNVELYLTAKFAGQIRDELLGDVLDDYRLLLASADAFASGDAAALRERFRRGRTLIQALNDRLTAGLGRLELNVEGRDFKSVHARYVPKSLRPESIWKIPILLVHLMYHIEAYGRGEVGALGRCQECQTFFVKSARRRGRAHRFCTQRCRNRYYHQHAKRRIA